MTTLLERSTVSRKTPADGRLELSKAAALRLEAIAQIFDLDVQGQTGSATLGTFECTCRGPDSRHLHYFLVSELLKTLQPKMQVDVHVDQSARRIIVRDSPV